MDLIYTSWAGITTETLWVTIPSEKGCVAHSDGDVQSTLSVMHFLGALALGSIGKYFPTLSDEYKGIDSRILLKVFLK